MKRIFLVFVIAFVLNFIWENLHSFLYVSYKGEAITESILLRATLADAIMIALITAPFIYFSILQKWRLLIIVIGIVLAISIELWALSTGRWTYNAYMPLTPFFQVGLTPSIQLGLLGYISFRIQERISPYHS